MTKLTIIGAGSAVFTKNIVTDLLSLNAFKKMEIALQEIDCSPELLLFCQSCFDLILMFQNPFSYSPYLY